MMRLRRQDTAGFTLIEMMIVVLLLALVASGITMGLGAITRSKLRSSCVKIVAAARFSYHRAVAQGNTVRIMLNLDEDTMSIEEANGRVTLMRADDEDREEGEEAARDPWADAQAALDETIHTNIGRSAFRPLQGRDGNVLDRYRPRALSAAITRVITPHDPDPREDGRAAIYFFPGGMTEHAVIQLTDKNDNVYTVEINALTGRGKIYPHAFEPEELGEDDVRDPG